MPSLAVESLSHRPLPSRHVVHHHRRRCCHRCAVHRRCAFHCRSASIAVAPSIAIAAVDVASWSRLLSPSRRHPAIHRVALPPRHPSPTPLRHRCAPFPLSSLVDCCLFTSPLLPSRLPSPSPSSTLRHCRESRIRGLSYISPLLA